eukprot:gene8306-biopygen2880
MKVAGLPQDASAGYASTIPEVAAEELAGADGGDGCDGALLGAFAEAQPQRGGDRGRDVDAAAAAAGNAPREPDAGDTVRHRPPRAVDACVEAVPGDAVGEPFVARRALHHRGQQPRVQLAGLLP